MGASRKRCIGVGGRGRLAGRFPSNAVLLGRRCFDGATGAADGGGARGGVEATTAPAAEVSGASHRGARAATRVSAARVTRAASASFSSSTRSSSLSRSSAKHALACGNPIHRLAASLAAALRICAVAGARLVG